MKRTCVVPGGSCDLSVKCLIALAVRSIISASDEVIEASDSFVLASRRLFVIEAFRPSCNEIDALE